MHRVSLHRARAWVIGTAVAALLLAGVGCAQGERQRGEPYYFDSATPESPWQEPPEPAPLSYAERLAQVPIGASEQETLEALLYSYCGECHGSDWEQRNPGADGAGMYYVDNIERLIATGKIIPGDPAGSKMVRRLSAGEMPPVSAVTADLPAAPPELTQRLSDFIASLPARGAP